MKPFLLALLIIAACPVVARAETAKPNIVVILADDLGYGDLSCYNDQSKVPTPQIDKLARQGMRFTDAHSPSTVCTPSRYSLLTGQMAFRINYRGVFVGVGGPCLIQEKQLTLPGMLRDNGYTTALIGKWHVGLSFPDKQGKRITEAGIEGVRMIDHSRPIPDAPIHRGFDLFFGTACCPTTDHLYAYIVGDRILVPPTQPLDKSRLPKHDLSRDNRMGIVAPDFDLEEVDQVFLKRSQAFVREHVQKQPGKPFFLLHSTQAVHQPSFPAGQFKGKSKAGPHGDFILQLDDIVGQLMQTLEEQGVAGNTLVVVTSDNGPEIDAIVNMRTQYAHDGARPWRGIKRDQWEGGHRVPFIVHWPGRVAPGSVSHQPLSLTDVMATCAAIIGAKLPDDAAPDSFDMLPAFTGKAGDQNIRPYLLQQTINLSMAIRKGPWKYLDHRGSGGNNYTTGPMQQYVLKDTAPEAPGQLYNLEKDPGETVNLHDKEPAIVKELKDLLESTKASGRSRPR